MAPGFRLAIIPLRDAFGYLGCFALAIDLGCSGAVCLSTYDCPPPPSQRFCLSLLADCLRAYIVCQTNRVIVLVNELVLIFVRRVHPPYSANMTRWTG